MNLYMQGIYNTLLVPKLLLPSEKKCGMGMKLPCSPWTGLTHAMEAMELALSACIPLVSCSARARLPARNGQSNFLGLLLKLGNDQ